MKTASSVALSPALLQAARARLHPRCIVCGQANPLGLGQEFTLGPDGSVATIFRGGAIFEGYAGLLHGGLTAALLDGAMTQCLFARGIQALTAELRVRYRHPISTQSGAGVRGWLTESRGRLHLLGAELTQDGQVMATAVGKFMEYHE
jgi:acyl-coenzyme A thioesterase PaaI-like protein